MTSTITHQLIDKAIKKAQSAQASIWEGESTSISFENDKLKSTQSLQQTSIAVKVILNEKIGASLTTDINDLDGVVERALETAEFGKPAHFQFPGPQPSTPVKVYDPEVLSITKQTMIQTGQEMIDLVKNYNPEILASAFINKHVNRYEFSNSNGTQFITEDTGYDLGTGGQLVRGTDILFAGHGFGWKKHEINHTEIANRAIHWFKLAEKIAPLQSGDMPIIFTPEGLSVLLLSLQLGINGKDVLLSESPLAGKLGDQIADPSFSMYDNPLIDFAMRSSPYDGEGVPHRVTPIIKDGIMKNFLYDLDTAARAGVKSTGNGEGCNPTNIVINPGTTPYETMVKNTKQGLLVHDVMGLGQGNPISGEFSINVVLGYKIENGEIVGRVKDTMLAGNVYNALKNIAAISTESEWVTGWFTGLFPYIQIGALSVITK